jgi:hypothetical protein
LHNILPLPLKPAQDLDKLEAYPTLIALLRLTATEKRLPRIAGSRNTMILNRCEGVWG